MIPTVTAGNVRELIAMAENDPDLSLAVLRKIQSAVEGASGEDKLALQSAALEAAINAAGMGQAIFGAAGELTNLDSDDVAKDTLLNAINGMQNLEASASILTSILPDPSDTAAFNNFTATANANDLAMAAALLIAGEAKKESANYQNGVDGYIDDLGNKFENGGQLSQSEELAQAMALAAALEGRENELSEPLRKVLSGLNLIKT
jgi:hypothetical protein